MGLPHAAQSARDSGGSWGHGFLSGASSHTAGITVKGRWEQVQEEETHLLPMLPQRSLVLHTDPSGAGQQ